MDTDNNVGKAGQFFMLGQFFKYCSFWQWLYRDFENRTGCLGAGSWIKNWVGRQARPVIGTVLPAMEALQSDLTTVVVLPPLPSACWLFSFSRTSRIQICPPNLLTFLLASLTTPATNSHVEVVKWEMVTVNAFQKRLEDRSQVISLVLV